MTDLDSRWPSAPTPRTADLRVATLDLPYATASPLEPGTEAIGRLVKVRVTGPAEAVFSLRHRFISTDIGLPGAGMPLEGSIRIVDGRARIAVYTNGLCAAFMAFVFGSLALVSVVVAIWDPGWEHVIVAVMICASAWWSFRRAQRSVPSAVADALNALGTTRARQGDGPSE